MPFLYFFLPSLQRVSSNQLTSLPDGLDSLSHLSLFQASSNRLTEIPPSVGNMIGNIEYMVGKKKEERLESEIRVVWGLRETVIVTPC